VYFPVTNTRYNLLSLLKTHRWENLPLKVTLAPSTIGDIGTIATSYILTDTPYRYTRIPVPYIVSMYPLLYIYIDIAIVPIVPIVPDSDFNDLGGVLRYSRGTIGGTIGPNVTSEVIFFVFSEVTSSWFSQRRVSAASRFRDLNVTSDPIYGSYFQPCLSG
jgi:hypothetical protein